MNSESDFASELRECGWIFDLWACGFDHISAHFQLPRDEEWEALTAKVNRAFQEFGETIIRADGDVPRSVRRYLDVPGDSELLTERSFLSRLTVVLRVIDQCSAGLNYFFGFQDRTRWSRVIGHMEAKGLRLNHGPRWVVLKPPPRFPPRGSDIWWQLGVANGTLQVNSERGEHWGREFKNLCRVPDIPGCKVIHQLLSPSRDFDPVDWSRLRIGLVPLIQDMRVEATHACFIPGPLCIVTDAQRRLIVEADASGDWDRLCRSAASAVRFLAERKVHLVLFPEAVVPDVVVQAIKSELYSLADKGSAYPVLVLAGTFERVTEKQPRPGQNQAVVLNGRGDELLRQSKLHPYEMKAYEQQRYGLDRMFDGRNALEHIETKPRRMTFCDSRSTGLRMLVAVCEDSAQEDPCLVAIRGMQPNLVLIPVMAGPLNADRGFALTVQRLTVTPGCLTIVVNSAPLARAEWRGNGASGTPPLGIVGLPQLNYPDTHSSFRLLDKVDIADGEGTEVLIFECPT